jgi:hypothetical protein
MGCRSLGTVRWCNEATVTPLLSRTVGGTRIVVRAEEELRGGNQKRLPEAIREIGGSKKEMTAHLHERKQGRTIALLLDDRTTPPISQQGCRSTPALPIIS